MNEITGEQWELILEIVVAALSLLVTYLAAKGKINKDAAKRIITTIKEVKEQGGDNIAANIITSRLKSNLAKDNPAIAGAIDNMVKEVKGKKKAPLKKRIGSFLKALVLGAVLKKLP